MADSKDKSRLKGDLGKKVPPKKSDSRLKGDLSKPKPK